MGKGTQDIYMVASMGQSIVSCLSNLLEADSIKQEKSAREKAASTTETSETDQSQNTNTQAEETQTDKEETKPTVLTEEKKQEVGGNMEIFSFSWFFRFFGLDLPNTSERPMNKRSVTIRVEQTPSICR